MGDWVGSNFDANFLKVDHFWMPFNTASSKFDNVVTNNDN